MIRHGDDAQVVGVRQRLGGPTYADGLGFIDPGTAAAVLSQVEAVSGPIRGLIDSLKSLFGFGFSNDGPKGLQPELEAIVEAHERGEIPGDYRAMVRLYLSARLRRSNTAADRLQREVKALGFDTFAGKFGKREFWQLIGPIRTIRRIAARFHPTDGDAVGGLNGVLRLHAAPEMLESFEEAAALYEPYEPENETQATGGQGSTGNGQQGGGTTGQQGRTEQETAQAGFSIGSAVALVLAGLSAYKLITAANNDGAAKST